MKLEDITFDESDKNLFQVDDARLRAEALKHSLVPRLRAVLNECVESIGRVYEIDALKDSRVSWYPHFRENRKSELDYFYEAAYASLSGKSQKRKWTAFSRADGKEVQALPFRYGLLLEADGLRVHLENYWLTGLTDESYRKLFDFHLENEQLIHRLCYQTEIEPSLFFGEKCEPISTFREHYQWMMENRFYENNFLSRCYAYPISLDDLYGIHESYVSFFPVYDSYLRIAEGLPVRFTELIAKLNTRLRKVHDFNDEQEQTEGDKIDARILEQARAAAEQRVKVMPAMRWRVFQRDKWKCVACGRGSHDEVILHIDHITPRSKGGKDEFENYQTLCNVCNLGKSNRDATDLRNMSISEIIL